MRRTAPRPLAEALEDAVGSAAPPGLLARVQAVWREVAGAVLAEEAEPSGEREGVVTVSCRSAVWAQELALMAPDLRARLNARLGSDAVRELRFNAARATTS